MPNCATVLPYPVLQVQKGLKVLSVENGWRTNPGAIDGLWGPNTKQALKNLLSASTCEPADIATAGAYLERTAARATEVLVPIELAETIILPAAARYRAPTAAQQELLDEPPEGNLPGLPGRRPRPEEAGPVDASGNALARSGFPTWGWWAVGGTAVVAVIALVWWWQKKRKRRK